MGQVRAELLHVGHDPVHALHRAQELESRQPLLRLRRPAAEHLQECTDDPRGAVHHRAQLGAAGEASGDFAHHGNCRSRLI